ncbi:MAG: tRNA (N6-threonylcarbamoyladenosine(37)-N6)-methyltransferase TrmO [Alphaproteobacteria bacterium]|nr:tRNA (N6-threonylcarbamoyladenosine(37)-N6)-methyltransferase TrmO [Alphaproteobacteria bacterium]
MTISLEPIGTVIGGRQEAIDDDWGAERAVIALDEGRFKPEAAAGLDAFSHIEVIFHFHQVAEDKVQFAARHPRGNTDWPKIGIFAQRGKARPNRIGVTVCRLISVEGTRIEVEGLDAIDGTPVLDIKPYMRDFAPRGAVREPEWAGELMAGYW